MWKGSYKRKRDMLQEQWLMLPLQEKLQNEATCFNLRSENSHSILCIPRSDT